MQTLAGGGLTADQASEVSMVLIESSIRTGDLDGAAKELQSAMATTMDQAKVYTLQALLARKRGNEAEAAAAMEKAVQINPESVMPE
jgi:Flp pilus assembly protein TadD